MQNPVKVKMTANQVGVAIDILRDWDQDPNRKGLIKIVTETNIAGTLDKFVWIQISGNITEDILNEFCAQVEIQDPFPRHF
jgi:hypothetical protein